MKTIRPLTKLVGKDAYVHGLEPIIVTDETSLPM